MLEILHLDVDSYSNIDWLIGGFKYHLHAFKDGLASGTNKLTFVDLGVGRIGVCF